MGCINGKLSDDIPNVEGTGVDIVTHDEENHDTKVIASIKKQINNHPEWFLLNNLLMSFVFFRNYETELYDFSNTAVPKEEHELDAELKEVVKKCILPGVLLDRIQEHVKFLNEESEKNDKGDEKIKTKTREVPLSEKTIYVVNNNIEVSLDDNDHNYTPIAVPGCRVIIEEISEKLGGRILVQETPESGMKKEELNKKGFLRLRVISNSSTNMKKDQLVERQESVPPPTNKNTNSKTSENEPMEESDEYSDFIAFNTPRNIYIKPTTERRETLPEECFKKRQIKKIYSNENSKNVADQNEEQVAENTEEGGEEEVQEGDDNNSGTEESDDEDVNMAEKLEEQKKNPELFEDLIYLSSRGFMEYFQTEVFPNAVGKLLGFSEEEIKTAQALPGCIICEKKGKGKYKIIPAVPTDWPLQAEEFIERESRKVLIDENKWAIYKWPTDNMVDELKKLNCVVIPKGFVNKKDVKNPDSDIEWEIHFPKTERFLELRLTHAQVRCYIFLIALFKTFIEKSTAHRGLVIEHIRTHLFWECEEDAKSWPEHKMGIKILRVIEDLNTGLSRRKIPNYFIKDKNIFENIPSMYIQFAQKMFHDVLQFPVMHFLEALKNFKFAQEGFYPVPNLNQLKHLLTNADIGAPKVVKKLSFKAKKFKKLKNKKKGKFVPRVVKEIKKTPAEEELEWKKRHEMNTRKKHIRMQQKEAAEAAKAAKTMEENRTLKIFFKNLEILRLKEILEFFINHFIEIVKKSKEIGPKNQSLFYLRQAWYNLKVLEDLIGSSDETETIKQTIVSEHDQLTRQSTQEKGSDRRDIAPPTPRRNKIIGGFSLSEENLARKQVKFSAQNHRSLSEASTSRIMDTRTVKDKKVKSVAFDESVQEFNA